jgi:predicted ATP-binding protein involved in virulence
MRIKKISVKNLFGIFNYEIPLNLNEHITIIHGPNGFGKTTLLRLLNAFFKSFYSEIRHIPFSEIMVDFDNNTSLCLKKTVKEHKKETNNMLLWEHTLKNGKKESHLINPLKPEDFEFPFHLLRKPGIDRINHENWLDMANQKKLSFEEVLDRCKDKIPVNIPEVKEPAWLKKIKNSIELKFIETQRLLNFSHLNRNYEEKPLMIPAVITYSRELANAIQDKLGEYAALSQSMDRDFPMRLVTGDGVPELTIDELKKELKELEEKRSRLMDTGLLDKEKEIDFKLLQKIDKNNRNVLSVYVNDVNKKLSVFDELNNKINLFVNIINNKFLYKKMSVNKKEGFVFKSDSDKFLSPGELSSGEQHELVLFYELLFKVNPDSLILIDEPELSLHIVWQQQFIKDLLEISKLVGFDVLIATHSPQIIHDRWDLTVELEADRSETISYGK